MRRQLRRGLGNSTRRISSYIAVSSMLETASRRLQRRKGAAALSLSQLRRKNMGLLPLIIEVLCGAAGGNIAGKLFKNLDMGTVGNSLAGIVGGGLGGQLINLLTTSTGTVAAPGAG